MAGSYRYSAALDKTYVEQRWADSARPAALQTPVGRTAARSLAPAAGPAAVSDPLRFVKTGQAPLVRQARDQLQVHENVQRKKCLAAQDEQEEQWQTNLDEWKSRRRKASQRAFQRVQDAKQLFPDSSHRNRSAPEQNNRRALEQMSCLTTGTELLSEYSSKAAPPATPRFHRKRDQQCKTAPSTAPAAPKPAWSNSMETASTKIQAPEPTWSNSMETASTKVQAPEPTWSNSMETASTKVQAPEPAWNNSIEAASTNVQGHDTTWSNSIETASTKVQGSDTTWSNSMETASTRLQAPESKAARPEAPTEATLSVSGRRLCSHCNQPLGHGAAMVIESLQLLYHLACFRCCVCQAPLGNGLCGTDVRVRNTKLHCTDCYSNDEAGVKLSRV